MPALKNQRMELFTLAHAKGEPAYLAYRRVYGGTVANAESSASRLLRNAKVKTRLSELRAKGEKTALLTMAERRDFLARAVRANLHNFDLEKDGDLIEEYTVEEGGKKRFKLPSKRGCVMDDAKLAGEIVDKAELTGKDGTPLPSIVPEIVINYLPSHMATPRIPTKKGKE